MQLSDHSCESLNFSGVGVTGATPQAASEALAAELSAWAAAHAGQRILQITPLVAPAPDGVGLAALIVHTAGSELTGGLAEQVAAAVEDALEEPIVAELADPARQTGER